MNIRRAKQEIMDSIAAYLEKDEYGEYRIPEIRQRPVLLMGPPGIGKTQIMEQIASECDLALVAYTITHHTRQSAVGLPFITQKEYGGRSFQVTEYTMSEIIASVYDRMEASGKTEGILFIDEINCVSETLAPTMLQFLQQKTFGNQKVPSGWIIVAAGNPPEYNKSVRDFDVVTLDRVKVIDVEPDFEVWKDYAYSVGIHNAVISYLDIHRENFFRCETTVDGKRFVTARGWEDLSEIIRAYEMLGKKVDTEVTVQYLQYPKIAQDFSNYLELFYKYQKDYQVDSILSGTIPDGTLNKLRYAPFDERLQIVSLLLSRLGGQFRAARMKDTEVSHIFEFLKGCRSEADPFCEAGQKQEPSCFASIYESRLKELRTQVQQRAPGKMHGRCCGRSSPGCAAAWMKTCRKPEICWNMRLTLWKLPSGRARRWYSSSPSFPRTPMRCGLLAKMNVHGITATTNRSCLKTGARKSESSWMKSMAK